MRRLVQPVRWARMQHDLPVSVAPAKDAGVDPLEPLVILNAALTNGSGHPDISWMQNSDGTYMLRANNALLARLRFVVRPEAIDPSAEVDTSDGRWLIRTSGNLISTHLIVAPVERAEAPTEFDVRRDLRHRWTLTPRDGQQMRWRAADLTSLDWVCIDDHGAELIRLIAAMEEAARVRLMPAAYDISRLALVLAIGWYLMLRYWNIVEA